MPLRRATTDTLCPGSRLSRTMASFCSGLQRRRRSWPKSSPLLSLLLVINITVCLSLIVRGKRCPVFHGARPGQQLHSAHYVGPNEFEGKTVLVVGGGNSGAQIYAEVSKVAQATWVTQEAPKFLPDEVDGRVLFERATARLKAQQDGMEPQQPVGGLGDIVMVPSVKEARERGVLNTVRPFTHFTSTGVVWPSRAETKIDAVIWCTGFSPALDHLSNLGIVGKDGKVAVNENRSVDSSSLWLVGYGDWTGLASATLIGVTRTARDVVNQVQSYLTSEA